MKITNAKQASVLLAGALASSTLLAQPLMFDANTSKVTINAKKLGFSNINANFSNFTGKVTFPASSKIEENIQVSLNAIAKDFTTGSSMQDKMFRSEDWLHVQKHHQMTFTSKKWSYISPKKGVMAGNLTVKGITKPVTFHVELKHIQRNNQGQVVGIEMLAKADIKRSDFGMNSMRGIIKEVAKLVVSIDAKI